MKCVIITVGKQADGIHDEAIKHFSTRLIRYLPLEWVYLEHASTKEKEAQDILAKIKKEDYIVLLDERGTQMRSEEFAGFMESRMVDSVRRLVFVVGGAYGVSEDVKVRANYTWKLSSLVFPHMLVRVILVEQLYRAMTILKGEKYHHV